MQIILICRDAHGSVAFPASRYLNAPERRYEIVDHRVTLSGFDDVILHHDVEHLLAMPDGLYRMPKPKELDAHAESEREAATVQEDAPTSKKKASGG